MQTFTESRPLAEQAASSTNPQRKSGKAWIVGVVSVYTAFAVATLAIVALTMTHKVDLVSEKYYQQEVAYQSRIDAANRAKALSEPVAWRIVAGSSGGKVLELTYPQTMIQQGISGTITFLRPSTMGMDKSFAIAPETDGKQRIALQDLLSGYWSLSLEWQAGGLAYYKASDVNL